MIGTRPQFAALTRHFPSQSTIRGEATMEYLPLGQSDLNVSVFALGCWPFAGGSVWGYQDDDESIATVHAALDAGINFFDTAEGYEAGHSERVLGRGLLGRRHEALIATKVSADHLRRADVIAACEQSLRNLQTDVIDLYQIHWPNWDVPLEETVGTLESLKQAGKIRQFGVSNFGVRDLTDILAVSDQVVSNQIPLSLLWRVIERSIQPLCVANGVSIIVYSPLAQGLLTGRYANADDVPEGLARIRLYAGTRPAARHGEPGCEGEVFAALAEIRRIADGLGWPMAELSLAWVRRQPGVTSILIGARSAQELALDLPALNRVLPADALAALDAATAPVKEKLGENPDPWMIPTRVR
jgi:aryl-alcohol dehydrogenase-like predicted oxidoreductase